MKILDEKVDLPSLFTVVLMPQVIRNNEKAEYSFITQSDGTNSAKSPKDMFPYRIPNDYNLVYEYIKKYEEGE